MRRFEIDKETFKKLFPHLAKELEEGNGTYRFEVERVKSRDLWRGYEPNVIDFIRRANTVEEAMEVIDFLEKRGEISKEYAEKLRKQLLEKGLASFGPHKEPGYYLKKALECSEDDFTS